MQTFLPYPSFERTMRVLDPSRLGNQIYREGLTLARGKWPNHPASRMWQGHTYWLCQYCLTGLVELQRRGLFYPEHFHTFRYIASLHENTGPPKWLGNRRFHRSHQSNLIRKNPRYYRQFFPNIPDNLPYYWPLP